MSKGAKALRKNDAANAKVKDKSEIADPKSGKKEFVSKLKHKRKK